MSRETVSVCATCPWRRKNQGKRHPGGWYTKANLIRLWNGLRKGEGTGMVCHASDPASKDYGSTQRVPETSKPRECGGALQLIYAEINDVNKTIEGGGKLRDYQTSRSRPFTQNGIIVWMERYFFSKPPKVIGSDDVGVPWREKGDENK